MPSQEEINELLARNPCARWLNQAAKATLAEAAASVADPNAWPSVHELVHRILDVPPVAFHRNRRSRNKWPRTVKFTTKRLVETIGYEHFEAEEKGFRRVLRDKSKLKTHGLLAGLPQGLYNWLVDDGGPEGEVTETIEANQYYMKPQYLRDAKKKFSNCPKRF